MTYDEKKLQMKDLCGRLPYGVKCYAYQYKIDGNDCECSGTLTGINDGYSYLSDRVSVNGGKTYDERYREVKPYLRPMSSMTEEEIEEYRNLSDEVTGSYGPYHHEFSVHCVRLGIKPDNPHECVDDFLNMEAVDWLNEHHFDYRGLIERGLALEAPKGIYKNY